MCVCVHKERLDVFEVKIEGSKKAGSHPESNPGHLACAASALPLSYDNRTTTSPHNPLYTPGTGCPGFDSQLSSIFASKTSNLSLFQQEFQQCLYVPIYRDNRFTS